MNVPTGYTALDLVGFTDKGVYNSATNYVQNDIVHYGGDMWRCLIDDTTNIAPSEGLNWTLWIGEPTNLTEAIIAPLEVSPATDAHSVGDQLIYNDVLYKVIAAISIGDSLTVGTNIEAARKIVYQISDLESDAAKNTALYGQTLETIGATAINNHTIGDYFLATDGKTYRCIAAITGGSSTITLNTNCVEQPIADILSPERFNLIKINSGDTIDDATSCVKIGNICIISGAVTLATASSNQITSICKMPLEYKPNVNHCPIFVCDNTNRIPNEGQVVFSATECYIRSFRQSGSTPSATDFSFMAVYLCA